MKTRVISAVALLLCALMILSGCTQRYKRISLSPNGEEHGEEDISSLYKDAEVVDLMSERFAPKTLPVYEISMEPYTDEEIKQLDEIFHPIGLDVDGNNVWITLEGAADIEEFPLSDKELEEKAWEYFNMIPGLDAKDFEFHLNGGAVVTNYQDKRYISQRTVRFYRVLDGFRIDRSEGYAMTFNDDGELKYIHMIRYSYKKTDKTIELIPETEAFERIKNPDKFAFREKDYLDEGMSVNDRNHAQQLEVNDFDIEYVNAFYDQGCTILQPVYVYTGRALGNEEESEANTNFVSWIIAISEKCTYTPISLECVFGEWGG